MNRQVEVGNRQAYEHAARMLAAMCWATHFTLVSGDQSPSQRRLSEWMRAPRLGDMVFADTAGSAADPATTVGRWVRSWTFLHPAEDYDNATYRDRVTELVWEIELLDGSLYSWSDVALLRVPADTGEWLGAARHPRG